MKTKKIIPMLMLVLVSCCFICFGCGSTPQQPVAVINGYEFQTVKLMEADDEVLIEIKIKNKNTMSGKFDFSELVLKLDDEAVILHTGEIESFNVGETKTIYLILNSVPSEMNVGDKVSIYYSAEIAGTFKVNKY